MAGPITDPEQILLHWERGIELSLAWNSFGDDRQNALRLDAIGTPQSIKLQQLMTADVFAQLARGELCAYGFLTRPTLSDGPVQIPTFAFERGELGEWFDDVVDALGRRYERVKVSKPIRKRAGRPKPTAEAGEADPAAPVGMPPGSSGKSQPRTPGQANGRPSNHAKLCAIVRELQEKGAFQEKLVKEREGMVRELARQRHPDIFPRPTQPSRSSIREAFREVGR